MMAASSLPPSRVGQRVAVGIATERSATTRLKDAPPLPWGCDELNVPRDNEALGWEEEARAAVEVRSSKLASFAELSKLRAAAQRSAEEAAEARGRGGGDAERTDRG